jgi:hypothetical protein
VRSDEWRVQHLHSCMDVIPLCRNRFGEGGCVQVPSSASDAHGGRCKTDAGAFNPEVKNLTGIHPGRCGAATRVLCHDAYTSAERFSWPTVNFEVHTARNFAEGRPIKNRALESQFALHTLNNSTLPSIPLVTRPSRTPQPPLTRRTNRSLVNTIERVVRIRATHARGLSTIYAADSRRCERSSRNISTISSGSNGFVM